MRNRLRRKNFIAVLIIIASVGIVYFPIISNTALLVAGDGIGYYLSKVFLREGLRQGELPWWNPYCSIGTPFFADVQQTVLNPINVIYFIFDTPFAFNLSRIICLIAAAFFMYLLIKEITGNYEAGLLTGLIYAFSTVLGGMRVEHDTIITTAALFPMVFYFLEKFKITNQTKWAAVSSAVMAVQFFSGFTQIVLYFDIACFFNMIFILNQNKYNLKKGILLCIKWIGLYLLLISVQLLPTIQLIIQSGRDRISWETFSFLAYDFRILLLMLFPYAYKNQFEAFGSYASSGIDIEIYIGVICLVYLIYELRYCLKEQKVKLFAGIWIFSFLFGMVPNIPIVGKIVYHIPIINSFRVCARSLPIFIFTSILLTGMGLSQLLNSDSVKKIIKINGLLLGFIITNIIVIYCIASQPTIIWGNESIYYNTFKKGIVLTVFLCVFHMVCLILLLKSKKENVKKGIIFIIVFFILLDVMQFSVKIKEKQTDIEQLLDKGISPQTELLVEEDTKNGYRSFAMIDRLENYFSPEIMVAKYQRNINSQNRFYNSYLTFLDKKFAYWGIKEAYYYPLFLQQLRNENGLVSMLGIHYIFDAWDHGINSKIIDKEQPEENCVYSQETVIVPASAGASVYAVEADWLEENSLYQIEFQSEQDLPELFYADFYNSGYDNGEQDGFFTEEFGGVWKTVISVEELPEDEMVYFRVIASEDTEVLLSQLEIKKVKAEDRYNEIIVSDSEIKIYENQEARKLLYVPEKVISVDSYGESWIEDGLEEVDKINYIADFGKEMDLSESNTSIEEIVIKRNVVSAWVSAETETFINHSQLAYPGWTAYIDGERTKLYTVNNLIQGVEMPAGSHRIEFCFEPMDVKIGGVLSIAGLVWCVIWIAAEYKKDRKYGWKEK